MLKKIGQTAREEIEGLLGSKVFLDLWVKVKPGWRNKESQIRDLGYRDEE
jgi:GTP-binding protein Era